MDLCLDRSWGKRIPDMKKRIPEKRTALIYHFSTVTQLDSLKHDATGRQIPPFLFHSFPFLFKSL